MSMPYPPVIHCFPAAMLSECVGSGSFLTQLSAGMLLCYKEVNRLQVLLHLSIAELHGLRAINKGQYLPVFYRHRIGIYRVLGSNSLTTGQCIPNPGHCFNFPSTVNTLNPYTHDRISIRQFRGFLSEGRWP